MGLFTVDGRRVTLIFLSGAVERKYLENFEGIDTNEIGRN